MPAGVLVMPVRNRPRGRHTVPKTLATLVADVRAVQVREPAGCRRDYRVAGSNPVVDRIAVFRRRGSRSSVVERGLAKFRRPAPGVFIEQAAGDERVSDRRIWSWMNLKS